MSKPFELSRFDVDNRTHFIDFTTEASFKDPMIANACIEVVTGIVPTLSHLAIDHDPIRFAQDLRQAVGRDGIPVCLSGGEIHSGFSYQLLLGLQEGLTLNGFVVSREPDHSDVMGFYGRQATVYPDKVVVERKNYKFEPPKVDEVTLQFPKVGDR
jgi:hypothetical protein